MDKTVVTEAAGFCLSVTRTVNWLTPTVVGMPMILPVLALRKRPAGSEPAEMLQMYGTNPPVARTLWL